jgi:A/G-specific adenine glycosylase
VVVPGSLTAPSFQDALLGWFAGDPAGRAGLPWRRTRDPWAVLVSEVMLQQTQVARVAPVFTRFMERFPTAVACAEAPVGEVVRQWGGLGYNRRAVNLHRAATAVRSCHGGRLPSDLTGLLALPGVGPYTARAVLAFAYGQDAGVLDTNSLRVLARAAAGRPLAAGQAQALADALVPPGRAWEWNSALLDLGATVCTASQPRCGDCPISAAGACAWRERGGPDPATRTGGRQSTFGGSDRQGRGRIVAALRTRAVPIEDAPAVAGWAGQVERAQRVVAGLVADGLARIADDGRLRLP